MDYATFSPTFYYYTTPEQRDSISRLSLGYMTTNQDPEMSGRDEDLLKDIILEADTLNQQYLRDDSHR